MTSSSDTFSQFVDELETTQPNSNALPPKPKSEFEQFLDHISSAQTTDRELIEMVNKNPDFIHQKTDSGFTALILAGFALKNLPTPASRSAFSLHLIEKGADVHARSTGFGWTTLISHIHDPHIVKHLLDKGVDPNAAIEESGLTALTAASTHNLLQTAKLLLDKGAHLSHPKSSWNPIAAASAHPDGALLDLFLKKATPQDLQNSFTAPMNPLHLAARAGASDNLAKLLKLPAAKQALNAYNPLGNTPLHLAAAKGSEPTVRLLLNHGSDVNLENKEHKTAFDLCKNAQIAPQLDPKGKRTPHPNPIGKKPKNSELAEPKTNKATNKAKKTNKPKNTKTDQDVLLDQVQQKVLKSSPKTSKPAPKTSKTTPTTSKTGSKSANKSTKNTIKSTTKPTTKSPAKRGPKA